MATKRVKSSGKAADCFGKLRENTALREHPAALAEIDALQEKVIAKAAKAYKAAEKQAVNDGDPDWKETAIKAANEAAAAEVAKYRTLVVGNVKALEVAAKKAPKVVQKMVDFEVLREEFPGKPPTRVKIKVPVTVEYGAEVLTPEAHRLIDDAKWPTTYASPFHEEYATRDSESYFGVWGGDASQRDEVWRNYRTLMERAAASGKPISYEGWKFDIREKLPAGYQPNADKTLYIYDEKAAGTKRGEDSGTVSSATRAVSAGQEAGKPAEPAKEAKVDTSNPAGLAYEQLDQFRKDEAVKAAEESLRRAKSGEDAPNVFTNGFKSKAAMVRAREEELTAAQSVKPDVWQTAIDASYAKKPVSMSLIDTLPSVDTKFSDGNVAPSLRRQLIENLEEKGYVREGDQYVYRPKESAASEKPESGAVATASPEPVPSGAPAKNLAQTDTKQAVVKNENSAGRVKNRGRLLVFDKPIQTPAGKILSYQWQSQLIEEVDSRGEEVVRRISDWNLAEENADTGKAIVHHFLLERPDGTRSIVSLESAIGALKGEQEGKTLKSRIAAARRLVVRQAELAQAESDLTEYERVVAQVKKEPVPEGEFVQDGNRRYSWMVDGNRVATMVLGHDSMKERMRTLDEQIQSEPRFRETEWQAYRVRRLTSIPAYKLGGRIADLKQLIKRDQQKMGGSLTVAAASQEPVKNENEGAVKEYAYGMKARPFDIGAQPKGFSRVDENDKRSRWGVIYYSEPLSESQVRQYELVPLEKEKAAPDPYRPSGNDFPSADIEPALTAAGDSKSTSKKASQASDLVIPRKADGTPVDSIKPAWDDKSRMDADQYGYVTDGKKLYIIDRQKTLPMQEEKPATTYSDPVPGKWELYVREYAEDGTQGKSKRMPIPENALYPVKSSEKWHQRKAEMEREKSAQRLSGSAVSGITSGDAATVAPAVRAIANDKTAPKHHRKVAADIASILETNPITVRFEETDADLNGYYDPKTNEVIININGPHELGINETILHELAHAVTDEALVNPDTPEKKALVDSIRQQFDSARKKADVMIRKKKALGPAALELSNDELLDEVRKLNDDALYDIVSGTRDIYEFNALAMTSRAMQKFLEGINPNGEAKTAWNRIVDAVAKFFGRDVSSAATAAYDALLKLTPQKGDVKGETRYSLRRTDSSVTPAQDAEYMAAVEAGDTGKAQAMVDEAAKAAGYDLVHVRGEDFTDNGNVKQFVDANRRYRVENYVGYGVNPKSTPRFYSIKSSALASQDEPFISEWARNNDADLNPKDIVTDAGFWDRFDDVSHFWNENETYLLKNGIFGIRTNDGGVIFDTTTALEQGAVVETSAVTRDESGNMIPLSQRFNPASGDIRYSKRRSQQAGVPNIGEEYEVEPRTVIRAAVLDRVFNADRLDPANIDDYQTAYELARKLTNGSAEDLAEIQRMIIGHPEMVKAGLVGERQLDALPAVVYGEVMTFAGRLATQGGYDGRADFSLLLTMMQHYGQILDAMVVQSDSSASGTTQVARRLAALSDMPFKAFVTNYYKQQERIQEEMLKQGWTDAQIRAMDQFAAGAIDEAALVDAVAAKESEFKPADEALKRMLEEAGQPFDPMAPVQLSPKELALLPKDIQQAYADMLAGKLGQKMDAKSAQAAEELFSAREIETERGIQMLADTFFIGLNRDEKPGFMAQKTSAVNAEMAGIIRETLLELGIVPNEKAFDPDAVYRTLLMKLGGDQLLLEKIPLIEEAVQQKIMSVVGAKTLEEAMQNQWAREMWAQWEAVSSNLVQSDRVSGSTARRAIHQVMQQDGFNYATPELLVMRPEHLVVAKDRIVSQVMQTLRGISETAPSNIQPEMWKQIELGINNHFNVMMAQAAEAKARANAEAAAKKGPDADAVIRSRVSRLLARHATADTPDNTKKKKDALSALVDEHLKKADPDFVEKAVKLGVPEESAAELLRALESTRYARDEIKKYREELRKDKAAAKAIDALMAKMGPRDKSVIRKNEVVGPVTIGDIAKILMEADPSKVHDMAWRRGIITAWLGNMGIMEARVKAESLDYLVASAFADAQAGMVNKFAASLQTKAPKPTPSELERIAKAIKLGFVSGAPTTWQEAFAQRFKMTTPSATDMQEMLRLENIRIDPRSNLTDITSASTKLSELYNKFKMDPELTAIMAQSFTQSMLTGFQTQSMQFTQGAINSIFRVMEGIMSGKFKKDAMAGMMRAIDESFHAYVDAFKSSIKNDAYRSHMQEEIQRLSALKQLLKKEWDSYKSASRIQQMNPARIAKLVIGSQDFARRLMSSADDAALTGIRTFVKTIEVDKLARKAGIAGDELKKLYDAAKAHSADLMLEAAARGYTGAMARLWVRDEMDRALREGLVHAGLNEKELDAIDAFAESESEIDVGVGEKRDVGSRWDLQHWGEMLVSFLETSLRMPESDKNDPGAAVRNMFFRSIFGFLRTPFNALSRQVYRSPFGLYRLAITSWGDRSKTLYERTMGTTMQRQQRWKEAIIWSTAEAALLTIAMMLNGNDDDPDDDLLIINGQGPEDPQSAEAWRAKHQANSIEIKIGKATIVIPFGRSGLEPIKPGLMMLGALRDTQLDGLKKHESLGLGAFALNYGVNTAYSTGTFGLKNVMDWKRSFGNSNRAVQSGAYMASSLFPWSSAMRSVGKLVDPDSKDRNTVKGAIASATPAFFIGEKAYNLYGQPVYGADDSVYSATSKRLMYGFGLPFGVFVRNDEQEQAVLNWTVKTGMAPTVTTRSELDERLLKRDKTHTPLTDDQWSAFSKAAGDYRLKRMKTSLPQLDVMNEKAQRNRLESIGRLARSAGLSAIKKTLDD